ncbi:MAG: DUF167 domain-containing protein [Candidatus Eisenbacteria bacterium]
MDRRVPGDGHARLVVRVQPGARGDGLVGRLADGTLKLRVTAPPEGGRANRAVETLLAAVLGVRLAQVRVTRGAGSRAKTIEIDGLDDAAVAARIETALRKGGASDGE